MWSLFALLGYQVVFITIIVYGFAEYSPVGVAINLILCIAFYFMYKIGKGTQAFNVFLGVYFVISVLFLGPSLLALYSTNRAVSELSFSASRAAYFTLAILQYSLASYVIAYVIGKKKLKEKNKLEEEIRQYQSQSQQSTLPNDIQATPSIPQNNNTIYPTAVEHPEQSQSLPSNITIEQKYTEAQIKTKHSVESLGGFLKVSGFVLLLTTAAFIFSWLLTPILQILALPFIVLGTLGLIIVAPVHFIGSIVYFVKKSQLPISYGGNDQVIAVGFFVSILSIVFIVLPRL